MNVAGVVAVAGTSLVSSTGGANAKVDPDDDTPSNDNSVARIPTPPNGGCICHVLRTGFGSSQGELIQMIEFSTQHVSADSKETLYALGILLVFALVAAGYVLKKGLEKGDRTTHELLLKCVIIITSVVPQQLPMQMALAVNTALMSLMKKGIRAVDYSFDVDTLIVTQGMGGTCVHVEICKVLIMNRTPLAVLFPFLWVTGDANRDIVQ